MTSTSGESTIVENNNLENNKLPESFWKGTEKFNAKFVHEYNFEDGPMCLYKRAYAGVYISPLLFIARF